MTKQLFVIFSTIAIIGAFGFSKSDETKETSSFRQQKQFQNAAIHYKNYCASCHGEKMEAFADRKWKYGNSREAIFKSIKNGYINDGMPAFDKTFKDAEIYNLTDYILEGIKNID
ncbi:cytochrome c, partial [Pseudoxanthomonas sp. SGD-10]